MARRFSASGELLDVHGRLPILAERLASDRRVVAAYLFGSYGTPEQTPLSDVDIAVLLRPEAARMRGVELDMIGLVSDALEEDDVSVTLLNRAPLTLQFEIVRTGRLLYLADEVAHADFVESVLKRFGDYAVDYRSLVADYDAALREDYLRGGS